MAFVVSRVFFQTISGNLLCGTATYIEEITCPLVDMNFIFKWSTRYLTSERSETSVYYINILMTTLLTIFQRFQTNFRRFPKIFPNLSEGQTNVSEHSPNIFRRLPKIAEDCRRLPRKNRCCFDHTARHLGIFSEIT